MTLRVLSRPPRRRRRGVPAVVALIPLLGASLLAGPVAGAAPAPSTRVPTVLSLAQASRQDVPSVAGSEPDTLVEPDIAVSPRNPDIAVAVTHDSRYADGGAVAISHAWTRDGGLTWRHAPVAGLTTTTGGVWERVSDPVLAFGPSGDLYLSTIALNSSPTDCRSVVLVSRSTDGGATFGKPVTAQYTNDCNLFNDKNWIAVDGQPRSPHRGRVYQFWSFFTADGAQQRLRWSDDRGQHWSAAVTVTPGATTVTQNSQALIQPDGTVTDVYLDYTGTGRRPDSEREVVGARTAPRAAPAPFPGVPLRARTSRDGGRTWSRAVTVATDVGGDVPGVRCCLPSAVADPVTGRLHAVWSSTDLSLLRLSSSSDGVHWSTPGTVDADRVASTLVVNADIAAYGGTVLVSWGRGDSAVAGGRFVQQEVAESVDGGRTFGRPLALGPRSDLRYAAQAGGAFPGDYIGTAITRGRGYVAWARSSTPPGSGRYHQVLLVAALRP